MNTQCYTQRERNLRIQVRSTSTKRRCPLFVAKGAGKHRHVFANFNLGTANLLQVPYLNHSDGLCRSTAEQPDDMRIRRHAQRKHIIASVCLPLNR